MKEKLLIEARQHLNIAWAALERIRAIKRLDVPKQDDPDYIMTDKEMHEHLQREYFSNGLLKTIILK